MRHRVAGRKLGRTSSHRRALFRNLVTDFLEKERVVTTLPKAKEIRPLAERMITLGKRETLAARRKALAFIVKKEIVRKVFETLAPRFADRSGGYTRIIRLGFRPGDSAEMALIELIGSEYEPVDGDKKKTKKKAAPKRSGSRSEAAAPGKTLRKGFGSWGAKGKEDKEDKSTKKDKSSKKGNRGN